jgi:hypothetical protein
MLWSGISKDISREAARHFVLMVESLKDMSATAFLVSFERYWADKWRWNGRPQQSGDGVALSGRGEQLRTEGMFAIFSALADKRDPDMRDWESDSIKAPFLARHGSKCSFNSYRNDGGFHKWGG